jgi:hypothetical protein
LGLRVTGMGSDAAAPGLISFWLRLPARIRVGISFARQMAWEGCSRRSHRDVIGIRLYGNRPETRTSPANTGPSRRRKRKSKLVPGERALQTLPGRGFNKWQGCLSWLPFSVSLGSALCKEPWDSQIKKVGDTAGEDHCSKNNGFMNSRRRKLSVNSRKNDVRLIAPTTEN